MSYALWDFLERAVDGADVSGDECDRILDQSGTSQERYMDLQRAFETCNRVVAGQEAYDELVAWFGKTKADEMIAAAQALEDSRWDHIIARSKLAELIEEQVKES